MNNRRERLQVAADAFDSLIPSPRESQERMMELGIHRSAFKDGTSFLPCCLLGSIFGAMMSGGTTVEQAKRWLVNGEVPSPEVIRLSVPAVEQIDRMRAYALTEFRAICRPGSEGPPLAFLTDQVAELYSDIMKSDTEAIPDEAPPP